MSKILESFIIFGVLLIINPAFAYPQNSNPSLRQINLDKFKEKFNERFCTSKTNVAICEERWKNISLLINFIKEDERVNNIGIATFLLATAYTETAIKNFSPSTIEIKGKVNETRPYWTPDKQTKQVYCGRGWIQLTFKEMYQKAKDELNIDFVNNPDLVLEPKNAYEILYLALLDGWLETYRSSNKGAAGKIPIKLTDFINENGILNYSLARATINANCVNNCSGDANSRFEYKKNCFIPTAEHLDASKKTSDISIFFENAIKYSLQTEKDAPKY